MTRSKLLEVSWGRIGGELVENWLRIGVGLGWVVLNQEGYEGYKPKMEG